VLLNDRGYGADGPAAENAFVWDDTPGNTQAIDALNTYGTLQLSDRGSWIYRLDPDASQALPQGERSYEITYTITDRGGDSDTGPLTIKPVGKADLPTISFQNGSDVTTVSEEGLNRYGNVTDGIPDGQSSGEATSTGTFIVDDVDEGSSLVVKLG